MSAGAKRESGCSDWHAEVKGLRAGPEALPPAASAAVCDVLASVLAEGGLEREAAATARSLLAELARRAEATSAIGPLSRPRDGWSGAASRAGSRLLTIARGRTRLLSSG